MGQNLRAPEADHSTPVPPAGARAQQVELIIRQIDSLPTLAPVAMRLMRIGNLDDADLDQVVELIESDPPLTAKLLGLCRRADKGLGDRITTVRRAVVMLGLETVQAAALSVAVFEVMQGCTSRLDDQIVGAGDDASTPVAPDTTFDRTGYWRHCIAVATASERIAETHPHFGVRPEEAFVSGLLHDLGKLVLHVVLPRSYGRILGLAERRHASSAQIESQVFGIDHHAAGRRIAEHWGLPSAIQDVIWLCGHPFDTLPDLPHRNLVALVGIARALCRHMHLGWSGDFNHPEAIDGPRGLCARSAVHANNTSRGIDAKTVLACADGGPRGLHHAVLQRCRALGLGEQETPQLLMQSLGAANRRLGRLSADLRTRTAAWQSQSAALEGIAALHHRSSAAHHQGAGILEMLASIIASARASLGAGFYATVHQTRAGEAWTLTTFSADGRPAQSHPIDTPHDRATGRCRNLGELGSDPAMFSVMGAMPWLADHLLEAEDIGRIRILALTGEGQRSGPAAALLHEAEPLADAAAMRALTASWAAAFAGAAHHESSRRLADQLAATNRQLAEAQAKMAEMQSLARLGEMAAGAAHEMNNPLAVISGRAEMLAEQCEGDHHRNTARAIVDAAARLTGLITAMDSIANPPALQPRETDLRELITAAIEDARARTASTLNITAEFPEHSARTTVDPDLLRAAITELIANALESSPRNNVTITTQIRGTDRRLIVSVVDDGAGMSPRAQQHAFDPFFSECPAGRRTGLGLTRARGLVELHGGSISLHTIAGQGTTATIEIPPLRSDPFKTGLPVHSSPHSPQRSETTGPDHAAALEAA